MPELWEHTSNRPRYGKPSHNTTRALIPSVLPIGPTASRLEDSLGLPISATYQITLSPLNEDSTMYHYELSDQTGKFLVSGPGNELTDVLLGMAITLEGKGKSNGD
jgi:hypothetical protein